MVQTNEDDDTAALSEVEIQAWMHECGDDEIAAPKKEYMFNLRL